MILEGISIKGSYHDTNQDSFRAEKIGDGFVVVLSDGLGSKRNSQYGSKAICDSVIDMAFKYESRLMYCDPRIFLKDVHADWLMKISEMDVSSCYATLLAFVIYDGKGFALRLGDGFVSFWADDQVKVLFDRKEDYFANETDCLTEELVFDKMEICEFEVSDLKGGVVCTDGVGIGNMTEPELKNFTKDFIEGYCEMPGEDIVSDIESWLSDWPGADDKTLAFFISERI